MEPPPCFSNAGEAIPQTEIASIALKNEETKKILLLLFNGRMFFTYWLVYGDEFHLTANNLLSFCLPIKEFTVKDKAALLVLTDEITSQFQNVAQFKLNAGKNIGSYNTTRLWHITDKSDMIFLKYLTGNPKQVFKSIMHHVAQTAITHKTKTNPRATDVRDDIKYRMGL